MVGNYMAGAIEKMRELPVALLKLSHLILTKHIKSLKIKETRLLQFVHL